MNRAVLILHNLPSEEPLFLEQCGDSDAGVMNAVRNVADALGRRGTPHRVAGIRRLAELAGVLASAPEPVVFNLVERLDGGVNDCNRVPDACEAAKRACTGGGTECLNLTLDKQRAKQRLRAHGVPVAPGTVAPVGGPPPASLPPGALFVKPLCSDGSEGIDAGSLVRDRGAPLTAAVEKVHRRFGQPALIEAYIDGREFNLALMERRGTVVALPVAEIDFSIFPDGRPHVVDYSVKWHPGTIAGRVSPRRIPAPVDETTAARLQSVARRAWQACGCRDYARVDTRMDASGAVFVLEVNSNCDLSPLAGFPAALAAAGIAFEDFVEQMVQNAAGRRGKQ